MIKKIKKEVWDFVSTSALVWWIGVMFMLGIVSAADLTGINLAIGFSDQSEEQ